MLTFLRYLLGMPESFTSYLGFEPDDIVRCQHIYLDRGDFVEYDLPVLETQAHFRRLREAKCIHKVVKPSIPYLLVHTADGKRHRIDISSSYIGQQREEGRNYWYYIEDSGIPSHPYVQHACHPITFS